MTNHGILMLATPLFIFLWLAALHGFARWSGWLDGRTRYAGARLQRGEWFFYRRLTFAGGLGSIPCNVIVGERGVGLASLTPLPFFAPIFFPWSEIETEVVAGKLILRTAAGPSFAIAGFRIEAIQEAISAARLANAI